MKTKKAFIKRILTNLILNKFPEIEKVVINIEKNNYITVIFSGPVKEEDIFQLLWKQVEDPDYYTFSVYKTNKP